MAPKKKSATIAKKRASKSPKTGTYTAPRGNVSIAVPTFWVFRQTNDDLQLVSPSGDVSLIVNAYSGNNGRGKLDARQNLEHLLASAPKQSRRQTRHRYEQTRRSALQRHRRNILVCGVHHRW